MVRRYPWQEPYTAERYARLLSTYSPVQQLPDNARRDLVEGARRLIEAQYRRVEGEKP